MTKISVKVPKHLSLFSVFFNFYWVILAIVVLSSACQSNHKKPSGIIPSKKMTSILIDLHLAEALVLESRYHSEDTAKVEYAKLEKDVFKKHQTDSVTYAKSYQYYAEDVVELNKIYNTVVDTLSQREEIAKAKEEKEDSLKNLQSKNKYLKKTDTTDLDISPKEIRKNKIKEKNKLKTSVK
jgi:predicted secreted protein